MYHSSDKRMQLQTDKQLCKLNSNVLNYKSHEDCITHAVERYMLARSNPVYSYTFQSPGRKQRRYDSRTTVGSRRRKHLAYILQNTTGLHS